MQTEETKKSIPGEGCWFCNAQYNWLVEWTWKSQMVCEGGDEAFLSIPTLCCKGWADENLSPMTGSILSCLGSYVFLLVADLLTTEFKVTSCLQAAKQRECSD